VDPNAVAVDPNLQALHSQVAPNPSNGRIHVAIELPVSEMVGARLLSLNGQEILSIDPVRIGDGSKSLEIDGSKCAAGIYFLEIKVGEQVLRHKVVIQ
jgi:hypothetical protein